MKKDIVYPEVTDVAVCVVKEMNELGEEIWNVYLVNLKGEDIENVFVSSKGYGIGQWTTDDFNRLFC